MSLDDRYADADVIAEGPVSVVFRVAAAPADGSIRWVAVKSASVRREFSKEPHDIIKEARLLSALSHPNIIAVLGHDIDHAAGTLHFRMPFVPHSLAALLATPAFAPHHYVPTLSTPSRATRFELLAKAVLFQLLAGVAHLHARGIAHRDIKPHNVLLAADGRVQLIDFGIAFSAAAGADDLWPETADRMYFEVSTGPYRAPELLFGTRVYDAPAADLWSVGSTLAEFFTTLRLTHADDEDDAPGGDRRSPFVLPDAVRTTDPRARWVRDTLFDGTRGEIGLAWSIFKIRGTPTDASWPGFKDLPSASSVTFTSVPAVELAPLLPNLPPAPTGPADLVDRFLAYPPAARLAAAAAMGHAWFAAEPPLLLPAGYLAEDAATAYEGKSLGEWLASVLPQTSTV